MNRGLQFILIGGVASLLAACQSSSNHVRPTGMTAYGTPTSVVGKPGGNPNATVYSKSKSKSWTSADGRTKVTKTKGRSASVSVDPNAMIASAALLAGGAMASGYGGAGANGSVSAAGAPGYVGAWQMTDGDNFRNCSIDLKPDESFGAYRAWTRGCYTTDLFQVGKWQVRGREVVLLDMAGKPQASLRQSGPGRLDGRILASGQPISMWR